MPAPQEDRQKRTLWAEEAGNGRYAEGICTEACQVVQDTVAQSDVSPSETKQTVSRVGKALQEGSGRMGEEDIWDLGRLSGPWRLGSETSLTPHLLLLFQALPLGPGSSQNLVPRSTQDDTLQCSRLDRYSHLKL